MRGATNKQSNQIDLRTSGGQKDVAVNPADSVVFEFSAQQSRIGAQGGGRGLYNCVRALAIKYEVSGTMQTGSSIVTPDMFPLAIKNLNLQTSLFGVLHDPNVMTGIVAKHFWEFFMGGYKVHGTVPAPIPANSSGSPVNFTFEDTIYLPWAPGWNRWADQYDLWLGWFDTSTLEIYAGASNAFDVIAGTGKSAITQVTISAELEMVPNSELIIPPIVSARRYHQAAAGSSSGPQLIGVGNAGSLQGTDDMARLVAMVLGTNVAGGFGGSGNATDINDITMPWRDQARTTELWAFFERFLADAKEQAFGGPGSSNDTPASLYVMPTTNVGINTLQNALARYTPLVWPTIGQLISTIQKVKGNYQLDMDFAQAQSAEFQTFTLEQKQFSASTASQMVAAAGIDPGQMVLVPKLGYKNVSTVDPSKFFCFPRSVQVKPAAAAAATNS